MTTDGGGWTRVLQAGWTNTWYDAKNSAGVWVNDACNGHVNNRGSSTWNDSPYAVCPVVWAGSTQYMTPHHSTGGTSVGAPYFIYVR